MSQKIRIIITLLFMFQTLLCAAPAISGLKIFTQPDGKIFKGSLKGSSAFHWIESDGEIIMYNAKDKFYYIAVFDKEGALILTDRLPSYSEISSLSTKSETQLSNAKREKLKHLYKKKRQGHVPR